MSPRDSSHDSHKKMARRHAPVLSPDGIYVLEPFDSRVRDHPKADGAAPGRSPPCVLTTGPFSGQGSSRPLRVGVF